MLVPWLRIIDAALGLKAAARSASDRTADESRRIDQIELERQLAERALKIELLRQAGDREIGRLRLVAGLSIVSWIGAVIVSVVLARTDIAARILIGAGWLALIAAVIMALVAQLRVSEALNRIGDEGAALRRSVVRSCRRCVALVDRARSGARRPRDVDLVRTRCSAALQSCP